MVLKADYEFIFVGKDDNSFLENYCYDLFEDFGQKSGQIFITLEIQNNPLDAEDIAAAIFDTMQNVFFEEIDNDPYVRFENSLKAVNLVLNEFKSMKTSGYIGNLNIIVAAIVGNTLYLSQSGDAEAYMIRKRFVSVISEGLNDDNSEDVFNNIASGSIEQGDFVMFTSARMLRYISKSELGKYFSSSNLQMCLEDIKDAISTEMLGKVAICGMNFTQAYADEIMEEIEKDNAAVTTVLEANNAHLLAEKQSISGRFFTSLKKNKGAKKGLTVMGRYISLLKKGGPKMALPIIKGFGGGKNKITAALLLMVIVLALGIGVVRDRSATKAEMDELEVVLNGVQAKLAEAETKSAYDKESAKSILESAYAEAMSVLNSGYFREKAKNYLVQIEEVRDGIDNVKRVTPKPYIDLASKRSDVSALGLIEMNGRMFAYEYNALYELVLDQAQDPLTIDDKETVVAASAFEDRNSLVFLTKNGKLIEYRECTMSFMDTDDGSFRKGVSITDWSNKIYILDPASGQIWRYTYKGTRDKFGSAEDYIKDKEKVDLAGASDISIDASVFVLKEDGDIFRFYSGNKAEFYINNAPFNPFKNPTKIFTDENLNQVFVVDGAEKRVFVFNKDSKTGNIDYDSQYLLEVDEELRDVYVDSGSNKMYVLSKSKVYEVPLNQ